MYHIPYHTIADDMNLVLNVYRPLSMRRETSEDFRHDHLFRQSSSPSLKLLLTIAFWPFHTGIFLTPAAFESILLFLRLVVLAGVLSLPYSNNGTQSFRSMVSEGVPPF